MYQPMFTERKWFAFLISKKDENIFALIIITTNIKE